MGRHLIFNLQLDETDIKAISGALADAPYKNVYAIVDKIQAQINQQIAADKLTAQQQPVGAENGGNTISHSS